MSDALTGGPGAPDDPIGPDGRRIDDVVQPFQIEASALRGRMVRLGPMLDRILGRHDYPEPVARLLGETITLAAVMASGLKYDGVFTLQTKGDAVVPLMVADVTSAGEVRGYAKVDPDKADRLDALSTAAEADVPTLLGKGYLAFTVDQGRDTDLYQGIVELSGGSVAECVTHYFRQSEQIDVGLKLYVGRRETGWRAGGLMVQRLPDPEKEIPASDREDDWRRAMILMDSASENELSDPSLEPNGLLYRLFHEDGVRVYAPSGFSVGCRCSRNRVANILGSFPRAEIEDMKVDGEVQMTCEFCNYTFAFDDAALDRLYAEQDDAGDRNGAGPH